MSGFKKVLLNYKETPLQGKIFYLLVIVGMFFAFISAILNYILHLSYETIIIASLTSLFCFFIIVYVVQTRRYIKAANVTFIVLVFFIYPLLWINNAGSNGPTPLFLVFNMILMSIILSTRLLYPLATLQSFIILILIYVEINFPELIKGYSSSESQILDLSLSALLIGLFTLYIIRRLMVEYNHRIKELHEVQIQLHKLSITDELTGIYNRRYIIQEITNQLNDDNALPFSLIMLDIDNFKLINDQYGHNKGDEVILGISQLLETHIRPIDIVGRIGGEEFLILLMDTTYADAYARAESMRIAISQLNWSVPNLQVTVSGGVNDKTDQESLDELLEKVDLYLYRAKTSGKNKIL